MPLQQSVCGVSLRTAAYAIQRRISHTRYQRLDRCYAWVKYTAMEENGGTAHGAEQDHSSWPLACSWAAVRLTCRWNPWHGAPRSASLRRASARPCVLQKLVSKGACLERLHAQAEHACRACLLLTPQILQLLQKAARRQHQGPTARVHPAARCLQHELRDLRDSSRQALQCGSSLRAISPNKPLDTSVRSVFDGLAVARRCEADRGAPCQGSSGMSVALLPTSMKRAAKKCSCSAQAVPP